MTVAASSSNVSPNVTGKLPIRPQYKKFIEWAHNMQPDEPLYLPSPTPVGVFLGSLIRMSCDLISSPLAEHLPGHAAVVESYGDSLRIVLSGPLANEDCFLVMDRVARLLDEFIPSMMQTEICARTQIAHVVGYSEKVVIQDFMRECGIALMVDFEALKKRQQRYREAAGHSAYHAYKGKRVIKQYIDQTPPPDSPPTA